MKVKLIIIVSGLFSVLNGAVAPIAPHHKYHNTIQKVFFHQGLLGDKIVCYLTSDPICNRWPSKDLEKNTTMQELVFFMPNTKITNEAHDSLKKIANNIKPYYKIQFEHVQQPMPGVKITLSYNPEKIGYEYEQFNPISASSGIVFHLYNKDVLKDLKGKSDPLLRTARSAVKPTVMIDCGHGGIDHGTTVAAAITEKEVNLSIGKRVADLLRSEGCLVALTRENDSFVPVDQRTFLANKQNADLFISIHANSMSNKNAFGIETYWAGKHLFKKHESNLDKPSVSLILSHVKTKDLASQQLAESLQKNSLLTAQRMHNTQDRKVRESVAQVLLGTEMPAALIEVGFLSNEREASFLAQTAYQQLLARGITNGITSFLKNKNLL